jgi:hypothetical protein
VNRKAAVAISVLSLSALSGAATAALNLQSAISNLQSPISNLQSDMELTYINAGEIALAVFLSLVNNRVIEYFAIPLFERFKWDKSLLLYVSAITGFAIALLANADLFMPGLFTPLVSKIISAIIIAGGSNLIHDITTASTSSVAILRKITGKDEKIQL